MTHSSKFALAALTGTAVGFLLLAPVRPAAADEPAVVKVAGFAIPADCPLARAEHPRLLFSREQLPAIRARLSHSPLKEDFQLLKQTIDDGLRRGTQRARTAIVPLGVLYHLTGDERYGQACRRAVLEDGEFGVYAALGLYGYDLVYDLMTPEERRSCEERSAEFLRNNRWRQRARFLHAVALYGSGADDALVQQQLEELYPWLKAHLQELNGWARHRGGDDNSHGYIGQHEYVGTMGAIQAWRTAAGEDLLEGFHWARLMPPYYIYHYPPGRTDTLHVGINCWGNNSYPDETGADNFVSLAQGCFQDGLAWWWIQNCIVQRRHDYQIFGQLWGPLLWSDPSVPQIAPDQLPPTMLFRERGYVSMRSDWSPEAVLGHFHCGRFESDGRNNADNNSFLIYRRGYLACDTGTRAINNPEQTQFSDGRHHDRYFSQTIAHNSITVGTADVPGQGWTAVCGGQVSRPKREWVEQWRQAAGEQADEPWRAGEIVAYQTHPWFDYAAGDASRSYSPESVRQFTRQFVYLRPDLFVVFDRVTAVRPGDPKRWYLHTMEEPQLLDGEERADTAIHPAGHFVWDGTAGKATHQGSTLFWKTLLPKQAIIRKIGGPGHQFEVNGENLDMYPAWYERLGQEFFDRIGLGLWRIEVEPRHNQASDVFLHVLQATEDGATRMCPAELLEQPGAAGARIDTPDGEIVLTFATAGPVGGRLRIVRAGEVYEAELAADVQDHYRAWRDDPRYGRWTDDPHLKAALTPSP